MSKLASFSNKKKEEIIITHICAPCIYCTIVYPERKTDKDPYAPNWLFCIDEIIFFNKKEKIVETNNNIYIIKSFKRFYFENNEENFWKIIEENSNEFLQKETS